MQLGKSGVVSVQIPSLTLLTIRTPMSELRMDGLEGSLSLGMIPPPPNPPPPPPPAPPPLGHV